MKLAQSSSPMSKMRWCNTMGKCACRASPLAQQLELPLAAWRGTELFSRFWHPLPRQATLCANRTQDCGGSWTNAANAPARAAYATGAVLSASIPHSLRAGGGKDVPSGTVVEQPGHASRKVQGRARLRAAGLNVVVPDTSLQVRQRPWNPGIVRFVQEIVAQGKQSVRQRVHSASPRSEMGFMQRTVGHNCGTGSGWHKKQMWEVAAEARMMQAAVRQGKMPREQG